MERQELLAVSGRRAFDIDLVAGPMPVPVLSEQIARKIWNGRQRIRTSC